MMHHSRVIAKVTCAAFIFLFVILSQAICSDDEAELVKEYHSDTSEEQSFARALRNHPQGTSVIVKSSSAPALLTISYVGENGDVRHSPIEVLNGRVQVGGAGGVNYTLRGFRNAFLPISALKLRDLQTPEPELVNLIDQVRQLSRIGDVLSASSSSCALERNSESPFHSPEEIRAIAEMKLKVGLREPTLHDLEVYKTISSFYPRSPFDIEFRRTGGLGVELMKHFRSLFQTGEVPIYTFRRLIYNLEKKKDKTPGDYRTLIGYRHWLGHAYEYEARKLLVEDDDEDDDDDDKEKKLTDAEYEEAELMLMLALGQHEKAKREYPLSSCESMSPTYFFSEFGAAGSKKPIEHIEKHIVDLTAAIQANREERNKVADHLFLPVKK